ncbi:MAG TPA: hypothetical protein VH540_24255 [Ktedonobacterales bacterium]
MARKDSEKDVERPRYYSQFWLDVAAGRKVFTGGKGALETDEGDGSEQDELPEVPMKGPAAVKSAPPPAAPAETPARWSAPAGQQSIHLSGKESLADLAAAAGLVDIGDNEEVPELTGDFSEDVEQGSETPLALAEEPGESSFDYANLYDEVDEEEEDEGWSPRRGKKPKKQEKPRRREKGRDY